MSTHDKSAAQVAAALEAMTNPADIEVLLESERNNPTKAGGRRGVLHLLEQRLRQLTETI